VLPSSRANQARTTLHDPARHAWAAVTIRVAWELYAAGVRPTPGVLQDARDHVLLSLPRSCGRMQAEELAGYFTREYLDRVQRGRYQRRPMPEEPVAVRPSWRERLVEGLDPVGEVVLRLVYGDGLSLEAVERLTRVDRVVLSGAREGVRSAMNVVLQSDQLVHRLDEAVMDRLLQKVARLPAADCQGGQEVASTEARLHAERCPRCARGFRLVRAGMLSPSQLLPPPGEARPSEQVSVLALHLHPEARHHRRLLAEALEPAGLRADDDALLVDLDRLHDHVGLLHELAFAGTPGRSHLRGALVRGPGRWTRAGLIGPVGSAAIEATRSRTWGDVDGCGSLPEQLPESPRATRSWMGAGLACLLALAAGVGALHEPDPGPAYPLEAGFSSQDDAVSAQFDADDAAYLLVLARDGADLRVVHASERPWDKAVFATGAGDYRLYEAGAEQLLLATSAQPFGELEGLFSDATGSLDPLGSVAVKLVEQRPDAAVSVQEL
jgi:hypothetical protein